MPEAEKATSLQAYAALNEDLAASGEMIVSESLADQSLAKHVIVRDGDAITTDGPIESTFATVRPHRSDQGTGIEGRRPGHAFKLIEAAQAR